ncbi:MAG TPA: PEP-CTERM sorting domain-containing protein [Myxococcota bacterium]|nr:PEP-CTERM sorting domain-containing protein [Myxococcota bacterium]
MTVRSVALFLKEAGVPAVPEPGTLLLLGAGPTGLVAIGRKRGA